MEQVQGRGLRGGLLYLLYLCNQREMPMLFFSFCLPGSKAGLGGIGREREGGVEFGSIRVSGRHGVPSLLLLGRVL